MDYPNLQRDILEEFASYSGLGEVVFGFHLVKDDAAQDRKDYFRVYNRTARGPRLSEAERLKRLKSNAKLSQEQADTIRAMRDMGSSVKSLMLRFKMSESSIYRILNGKTYT